jgi:glucose/arabinose dehydrogenase
MKFQLFLAFIALFLLTNHTVVDAASLTDDRFIVETVAGGFVTATTFAFIDQERMLVGQKNGVIWLVENGITRPTPLYTIPNVNTYWDRGLLGLTIDPNFAQNGYIYVSYTHEHNPADFEGPKTARIVRLVVDKNTMLASSPVVLVGNVVATIEMPSCSNFPAGADCMPSDSPSHSAGGLRFGPDGYLYATIGDGAGFMDIDNKALKSQDLDSLAGKVLRIDRNGIAPASNPFYTGNGQNNRSKVFAYGLRNSYRFNFHPTTEKLYAGEVGWYLHEEINLIEAGNNLGWPCREGFNEHPLYNCTALNVVDPIYVYGHNPQGSGNAITGGAFATSPVYEEFRYHYFFGDYSRNFMKRAEVDGRNIEVFDFGTGVGGPVDIQTGPDGLIYYVSIYTGEIRRINARSDNQVPTAVMNVGQSIGNAPATVTFNAVGSSDPDGDSLSYQWTFGDGAVGTGVTTSHTYTQNGIYTAFLTVNDGKGGTAQTSRTITVGAGEFPADPYIVSSTQSPNPLYLGQDVTVRTVVENRGVGADVLAYYEVYDDAGNLVSYHVAPVATIAAGATHEFSFSTLPPVPGNYSVSLGLFSPDWRHMYGWITGVRSLAVLNRIIEQPQLSFEIANGATTGAVGSQLPLTVSVNNAGTRGRAIVYVEFYDATGTLESHQYKTLDFSAGVTTNINFIWSPSKSGAYTVSVGLFDPSWATMYEWVNDAYAVTIGNDAPTNPSFRVDTSNSVTEGQVGIEIPLSLDIRNIGTTGNALVYVEFYRDGALESYQYLENAIAGGGTATFGFVWTPQNIGTYTIAVGLFDPSWATMYEWVNEVSTVAVN